MHLIRDLVLLSLKYNFLICSKFVPGCNNLIPDTLSRFQETAEFLDSHGLELAPRPIESQWHPTQWMQQEGIC